MKIGVFDSGVGGENVVEAVKRTFQSAEVVFRDDRQHLPYGDKTPEQIISFMSPILKNFLERDKIDALVIACNTASTNALPAIKEIMNVPVVGFVPMIKPASKLTRTGVITVCATPGTIKSSRYQELKQMYARGLKVIEPDCSDWAEMIERNDLNEDRIELIVEQTRKARGDVIVLGCTHYHWIEKTMQRLSGPEIQVIQPTEPVMAELKRLLNP